MTTTVKCCTWKNCNKESKHPQTSTDGEVWANLCDDHYEELERSYGNAPKMLSAWVRAQGGSAKVTKRMIGER